LFWWCGRASRQDVNTHWEESWGMRNMSESANTTADVADDRGALQCPARETVHPTVLGSKP